MRATAPGADTSPIHVGTAWVFGGQLAAVAFGFGANILIARVLGADGQGTYAVAIIIPTFGAILLGAGLPSANTHFAGRAKVAVETLVTNSVLVAAVAGILLMAASFTLSPLLRTMLGNLPISILLIAIVVMPLLLLRQAFGAVLLGLQRVPQAATLDLAQGAVFFACGGVLLLALGAGPEGAILAYGLGFGVAGLLAFAYLWHSQHSIAWRPDGQAMRDVLGFGLRTNIGVILQYVTYRLDLILVNLLLGVSAAGVYSVSARLGELLWLFPSAVGSVVFARVSAEHQGSHSDVPARAFGTTLALTAVTALGLLIFGPWILQLFGAEFRASYQPLTLLLPGAVLLGASGILANGIAGRGRPGLVSIAAGIACGMTVFLDVTLIPAFGLTGAAVASSIAYSTYAVVVTLLYLRVTGATARSFVSAALGLRSPVPG